MARGSPGQRREAVRSGEERGLGRKASQVEVIWEEKRSGSLKLSVSRNLEKRKCL